MRELDLSMTCAEHSAAKRALEQAEQTKEAYSAARPKQKPILFFFEGIRANRKLERLRLQNNALDYICDFVLPTPATQTSFKRHGRQEGNNGIGSMTPD